ncbi:MAG TPA: GPP34 family phosphoprotein [Henriciella marina]|nr:GPP34 family phosphoprotein [Henriciella sp.]HIK66297.1 GPP34 family phosphoprotein [Henriciella marina]
MTRLKTRSADVSLTIPESLLLLSRKDDTGQKQGSFVEFAIAGGALAEMMLRGCVVQDEDRPKHLNIVEGKPAGDAFLDACLEAMRAKGSGKPASRYVTSLANKSKLMREQARSLVRKGVLYEKDRSFLVFSWKNYPEANGAPEAELIAHLSKAIAGEVDLEPQDCVVIALGDKTGLLSKNVDKSLLKMHKKRIKEIAKGAIGPTKAAMQAIDAVIVSIAASTAVVAAAGSTNG